MQAVRESSVGVSEAIRSLGEKSDQIGGIVGTITGIAAQTNLLALNAAIEAARAGEQGRGFAVVAEEVRHLAEESQAAASEISELITAIQGQTSRAVEVVQDGAKRTDDGVAVVSQTKQAFVQIGEAVEGMTARIDEIAVISEEIASNALTMQETVKSVAAVAERTATSAQQVSASAQQVSASADQVAVSAEGSSAAAQEVSASAEEVSASADQVAVSAQEASAATQQVSASAEEVSASTEQSSAAAQQVAVSAQALAENAQLLAELVAQFKVAQSEVPVAV
jgi:methyl-accepting chemotaxis protein